MRRRVARLSALIALSLAGAGGVFAQDSLFDPASFTTGAEFYDGSYLGASLGSSSGSPGAITTSIAYGRTWVLGNFLLGGEISGETYNDGTFGNAYLAGVKAGVVIDRLAPYGILSAGVDLHAGLMAWRATAGLEYALTQSIGLNGEISSTQPFDSFGTVIQAQAGLRVHFDDGDGSSDDLIDPAFTADTLSPELASMARTMGISEIRLGGALSNLELSILSLPFEPDLSSFAKARPDTLQADVFFNSPALFEWIGSPRLQLGAVVNLQGYESMAHAGLDWHLPLGELPLYVELGAGVGIHNGYLDGAPPGYRDLGCRVLHEWQYGLGYNLSESLTVTAQWKHVSGFLFSCYPNEGINTFGVVAGLKF